jgi:pyrimidine-nucleoside phosphorylase
MNPVELIRKKRSGDALTRVEMESFIGGFLRGDIPDYQMSAFLMAVYFRGMDPGETATFADVMLRSGSVIDLSAIPGKKVDKHSTGGVGDKVSLILAPMVAACGVPVPMISGRGLGHTGGTLDKLEAIPGFRTDLSIDEYRDVIRETGLVMIGQTAEIAPADRRMYALRDVTGTVESIPLIAGSIMSKKLAEGIDALVLDVKTGSGAFMKSREDAEALATALVGIGTACGKETVGFITDMNQPLGFTIGNWLEVLESVECLRGRDVPDLMEVTCVLGGAMVHLGGKASSIEEGMAQCKSAVWSGKAYEKFLELITRQGGDVSSVEHPAHYPPSKFVVEARAASAGVVTAFDTMRIGVLAVELGAGRLRLQDAIDPKAGMVLAKKIGDRVEAGDLLAEIRTDRPEMAERAPGEFSACVTIGPGPAHSPPPVLAFADRQGIRPWQTPRLY